MPSRGPNDLNVYEPQQNLGRGLQFITNRSKAVFLLWFMLVRFMFIFDFVFFLFGITWWSSAGKQLSPWLSSCDSFILCQIVCVPFPFGVRERMWSSIVSVLDHCLYYVEFRL